MTADDTAPGVSHSARGALGGALRRALAGYRLRMDQELAAAGFDDRRFPQGRVLRMCAGPSETTISDIGRELGISRQGASKVVAGLRERGYVAVTPSAVDGREKFVTLTPRAVGYMTARREAARAIEASVRREIGADGMEQLFRYLDVLAGAGAGTPGHRSAEFPAERVLRFLDAEDWLSEPGPAPGTA
jgi:DNA-binding MarR family transcriptional regulator